MKKKLFIYCIFFIISINYLYSNNNDKINNNENEEKNKNINITINDIYIKGDTKYNKEFVSKISGISSGSLIDPYGIKINNIIKKLWDSKLFEDISIYKYNEDKYKNKIDLIFDLKDLNEIHDIQFKSDGLIVKSDFPKINNVKSGDKISESMIKEMENEIKNFYKEDGYNEITINHEIKKEYDKNILFFYIEKGKKIKIEKFVFYGNNVISDKELLSIINRDKSFLSLLINRPNHIFVSDQINKHLDKIKEKYQSIGYRFAKVFLESVWKTSSGNYGIKIKIVEGSKYYLGKINITGNKKVSNKYLEKVISYNNNENIYDKTKLTENIFNPTEPSIVNNYFKLGHLFINLNTVEKIKDDDNKIDINILIEENSPVYIRNIKILGNNITKDYVIKREIKIYNKDIFSIEKLMESLHNIENLFLFDKVYFEIIPINDESVDIEWHVLEKDNNEFKFHGGIIGNDIRKLTGGLKIILNNFSIKNIINWKFWKTIPQGDGDKIIFYSQFGKNMKSFGLSLLKPWIKKDEPTSLKIDTNYSVNKLIKNDIPFNTKYCLIDKENPFFLRKIKMSIGLDKDIEFIDPYSNISTSIHGERWTFPKETDFIKICDNNNLYKFNNLFCSLSFKRNTISPNNFFPTDGSKLKFYFSSSPPYSFFEKKEYNSFAKKKHIKNNGLRKIDIPFFKHFDYSKSNNIWTEHFKLKLFGNFYKKIKENLVLKCQGELGHVGVYNKDSGRKLTPFDMFYMGGTSKKFGENHIPLKGYSFPENNSFYKMSKNGGTSYKKISLEMHYLINGSSNNFKTWLNSFIEAGNIGNSYKSLTSLEMNKSLGFGLRCLCSPFGILGIDFSYPLSSIEDNFYKKWKISFNIGKIK
ncbi:BamA/OMP85 family outer membrane protein [Blattabacterium cuenoti]|uniref:BamA/OMP85 family outer membrane protein n=1 Tax=Blattabacterium cuenoti TaxID=1653831 RepID=UPI00163BC3EF|nr:POTRA domain-containing protein [Blattabacterium cuenoti]